MVDTLFYLRSVAPKSVSTMDIYWGAVPFVAIQAMMVAAIIAFPGIVTGNVVHAPGTIKGTGADELKRQLEGPAPTPNAPGEAPKSEDNSSDLERQLRGR